MKSSLVMKPAWIALVGAMALSSLASAIGLDPHLLADPLARFIVVIAAFAGVVGVGCTIAAIVRSHRERSAGRR